jgi:tetratricopeptide (TPR) repeat protein
VGREALGSERSMRRSVFVLLLVAAAGVAAALGASTYASEREFERLIAVGDGAMAEDQPFAAIEAYSGAITLKPGAMLGHLKRGQAYLARSEFLSALRDLHRATALDSTAPLPLELLGDANAALSRHARAIQSYEARLALDDRAPGVQYRLGLAHYRNGDPAGAIRPLRQSLALDRDRADAHYLLGLCLRDVNQPGDARAALETATKLAPGLTGPREALAGLYEQRGESKRALEELEALVTLEPGRPERAIAVALVQARLGRRDVAIQTLGRAIDRFPDSALPFGAVGHIWLEEAERADRVALSKALDALTEAATHPDATSGVLTDLGRASMLAGDMEGAERALRQATSRLPVPAVAYRYLATLATRKQQWQAARDHLVRYATLVGDRHPLGPISVEIGDLSERIGEPQVAARWLERAMDESGASADRLARIAELRFRAGDAAGARMRITQGLVLDPVNATLLRLRERVGS